MLPSQYTIEMSDYKVVYTVDAVDDLADISDKKVRKQIATKLRTLSEGPEIKGKKLGETLEGYFSIRVASQRYRAIYSMAKTNRAGFVVIEVIGIRKEGAKDDAYTKAKKRL